MKNLISIEEIKEFYKAGEKELHICKGTLVTDAARDMPGTGELLL